MCKVGKLVRAEISARNFDPDDHQDRQRFCDLFRSELGVEIGFPVEVLNAILSNQRVARIWLGQVSQMLRKPDGSRYEWSELEALDEECDGECLL